MNTDALADKSFQACEDGEVEAVESCFREDAIIWHNFDNVARSSAPFFDSLEVAFDGMPYRRVVDRRRHVFPGGVIPQHMLVARDASGNEFRMPASMIFPMQGDRIQRLEKYIDISPMLSRT